MTSDKEAPRVEIFREGDGGAHGLMNHLIVPRAIAWVSTRSARGVDNLAPHSYVTVASSDPPVLCFVSIGRKDTVTNMLASGEFVICRVTESPSQSSAASATLSR